VLRLLFPCLSSDVGTCLALHNLETNGELRMFEKHEASDFLRRTMASLLALAITRGTDRYSRVRLFGQAGKQNRRAEHTPLHRDADSIPGGDFQREHFFDHYFGTYPECVESRSLKIQFKAKANTPPSTDCRRASDQQPEPESSQRRGRTEPLSAQLRSGRNGGPGP
jgi:hypothetical protein